MILAIPFAIVLIYGAWFIRCIMNAQEEKECRVTERSGLSINEDGQLTETITATFHRA